VCSYNVYIVSCEQCHEFVFFYHFPYWISSFEIKAGSFLPKPKTINHTPFCSQKSFPRVTLFLFRGSKMVCLVCWGC